MSEHRMLLGLEVHNMTWIILLLQDILPLVFFTALQAGLLHKRATESAKPCHISPLLSRKLTTSLLPHCCRWSCCTCGTSWTGTPA